MITDMISTAPGFQTSVNISYDLNNPDKIRGLIPTTAAIDLFEDFLISTDNASTNRARILIGAYGKGKSHIILVSEEDKMKWLIENIDLLYGQGLIYCNDDDSCKYVSKQLRKKKIKAEAYVDVYSSANKERVNYLTNSFSNGGLPVLVTTHSIGKNLTNPNIRFVIHYDIPEDKELYQLHLSQIGQLADNPLIADLCCI